MGLPRVLVVDDVPLFRELMVDFLAKSSLAVQAAGDGQEALLLAQQDVPALIFLDLRMPLMDGAACCRSLKADPRLGQVPVVMMITAGKESDRQVCLSAGCDAVITKPLDRREFLELASRFLYGVERRDERYPCQATIVLSHETGSYYGTSKDMSLNGMFIAAKLPLAADDRVVLNVLLSTNPFADCGTVVIEAKGRVAWQNSGMRRPKRTLPEGVGIELQEIAVGSKPAWQLHMASLAGGIYRNAW
jgi:CheY-like chemotaxis protein